MLGEVLLRGPFLVINRNLLKQGQKDEAERNLRVFPGGSDCKTSACNAGDPGSIPGLERRRKRQPTPVLLPGQSHRWRSLVGYSPWCRKESDTTE